MKVYFAGSIRGGRQDAALYGQIVRKLKRYGRVLTEHVGETSAADDDISDEAIYERDMTWLKQADMIVAEVTVPSHGVGYEIARAETLGLPVLCLYRPQTGYRLSALIAGNPAIRCKRYQRPAQLDEILEAFFRQQAEQAEGQD